MDGETQDEVAIKLMMLAMGVVHAVIGLEAQHFSEEILGGDAAAAEDVVTIVGNQSAAEDAYVPAKGEAVDIGCRGGGLDHLAGLARVRSAGEGAGGEGGGQEECAEGFHGMCGVLWLCLIHAPPEAAANGSGGRKGFTEVSRLGA